MLGSRGVNVLDLSAGGADRVRLVAEEPRHQYLLGYSSKRGDETGRWRAITVRTARPGANLATRSGYYAGGNR